MMKRDGFWHGFIRLLYNFVLFFAIIAFSVTCSILLFFSGIEMSEAQVREIAPVVFINVILLTVIFVVADHIRRRITVERPSEEIQKALTKMKQGDFNARVRLSGIINEENRFYEIAESVNDLGEELSGIETLRTDFISNVSHEMKTPLAVISNYGTLLQSEELTEEQRLEYAKGVADSSRRLSEMMTNILKLNRLENQQIYPDTREFDLGEQICECLLQFESIWEKKSIEIDVNLAENVNVRADAELLSLIWNNLLSNAFKFTDDGGRVSVSLEEDGEFASVRVTDTGCGMSSETGARIFEKFYQGDTSRATQGNGLGLALVKRVVDIIGGEISVESALGVGSEFTVRIKKGI